MNLYQEQLMQHFRIPYHRATPENPDFVSAQYNPSCGDSVMMSGFVQENKLSSIFFMGSGCVISQATASMLAQAGEQKTIQEILQLDAEFIQKLILIELGPNRLKCALLALHALQQALQHFQHKN